MTRTLVWITLLLLTTPLAVAQANPAHVPAADAPTLPVASSLDATLNAASAAASGAGAATADAAAAVGAFVAGAFRAIGSALASAASFVGAAGLALLHGIGAAFQFIATALVSLLKGLGAAGLALAVLIGTAAKVIGAGIATAAAFIGSLFLAGARTAVAHPKETAIITGSATGFAGILWALKRFGFLAGIPLYTRLAPGEMLENKARSRVYDHIRAHPGAHPSGLAEELGLGWGTITYHLSRLEESKLVTTKMYNNRKCYFVVGSELDGAGRTAVAALSSDPARRVVEAVRAAPGISQKDLAEGLGISQALASWHVKRLVAAGVLETIRVGRSNTLTVPGHVPAPALAA